ncbi:MAG: hypothetical protein ACQ5SW_07290 [Sphaerochaetaceae bacterium]
MKKSIAIILTAILMTVFSSALFAAGMQDTAVLRLHAYIPEKSTFTANEAGQFEVASNAENFSYSVAQEGATRTLFVVAD